MTALMLSVLFLAPGREQTNSYALREKVAASQFGSVVMTGIEKWHIGEPKGDRRAVDITFDVTISEKGYAKAAAERWAQAELADLRAPDHGWMDGRGRVHLAGGVVSVDSFPIFDAKAVSVGSTWQEKVSGQTCRYTLSSLEAGVATISTDSQLRSRMGLLNRKGSWRIEAATGRLLGWSLHSEVTFRGGSKESVDSSGELSP